jgi:hypothetical protein
VPKLDADKQNALERVWSAEQDRLAAGDRRGDNRAIAACARLQEALANRGDHHYRHAGKRGDVDAAVAEVVRTSFGLMPDDSPAWTYLTAVDAAPAAGGAQ